MRKPLLTSLVATAALVLAPLVQASPAALDFNGGDVYTTGILNNIGWSFSVSTGTIRIDGLGLFDVGADGLSNRHQVGLWRADGALLAQATVSSSSTAVASAAGPLGQWLFEGIDTLTLTAGNYVIGAFYADEDADFVVASTTGTLTAAGLAYTGSLASDGSAWAKPGPYGLVQPSIFGPNLRLATVPEPMTMTLVALALGAAFTRRRRSH
ncbi:hypothetical protein DBR42_24435 [Pelomonas sp. HMWF004]|nr:hypothetical protein DBR42_24435 [Pelomonas sp. HMWF004]